MLVEVEKRQKPGAPLQARQKEQEADRLIRGYGWIVESEGSRGNNYAVRALCTSASLPEKTQTVNIIVRTLAPDRAAMGRIYLRSAESVFDNLKTYLRCP